MSKMVLFITLLVTAMLVAEDKAAYACKYCGEKFSSASGARTGYCTYSANHRLAGNSGGGCYVCRYCGEKFSSPSGVRTGYCTYSANHKHQLAGQADERQACFCQFCGERFSSPSSVRTGYCTYSENHKHTLSSVTPV